ncbi:unnamed protein product [Cylindrotheca closterium]|uniref:Protein kinase domain-containing protein n=1 Tax=Cylindrotheca closterium TaxID=2856 RepID=A0AAD2JKE5_9STRA|nr:unnamed protein product [Cylindrotheca closterium]
MEEDQSLEEDQLAEKDDNKSEEELSMIISNSRSENIRDHYEFLSDIGQGSFGNVHKVRNKHSNEELACKTIPKNGLIPTHIIQREVAALRTVQSHPHLIELKDEIFEDQENIHIVTELCIGGELYDRVATGKWALNEKQVATLIGNILEAIAHCHERGVVHRDLKASNFCFANNKTDTDVRIIDFGLSKVATRTRQATYSQSISANGEDSERERNERQELLDLILQSQVGTPYYVAPEVLSGDQYNVKCDVWSVGVICYLVLSRGRLPFCGSDELETLQLLKDPTSQVVYPKRIWRKFSPDAKDFCQMLLERDPILRPSARSTLEHKWLRKYRQRRRVGPRSWILYAFIFVVSVVALLLRSILLFPGAIQIPDEKLQDLLRDRTVLVTGANSGLGLATVQHLARIGTANKIILACRNTTRCQDAKIDVEQDLPESSSTQVLSVLLDLANRTSIAIGAASIQEEILLASDETAKTTTTTTTTIGPLDILINNAGVAYAWSSKEFVDGIEMHMAINHLGHVLLTHYLWKNLLASTHGARIVHVSSLGALVSRHDTTDGWYNQGKKSTPVKGKLHNTIDSMRYYFQSKRANLQQTWELHRRLATKKNNVAFVASHPGYTRSEIMLKFQLPLCPEFAMRWLRQNEWGSMSTKDGAKTQLFAALSPEVPSGSYVVPQYWTFGRPIILNSLMTSFSSHFYPFSESESSRLWDESLKALDISAFGE